MELEITKNDKDDFEAKIDNITTAELLRVYLNKGGIQFAAWRREHPTKPIALKIQSSKTVKKEVSDAVSAVKKDLDAISKLVKK